MTFAPIALFVYNRPAHTRQTVEALKKNALAKDSDLIIFSDAAKSESQAETVREVRQYIHQIDGFKSVTVVERDKNWGLANSIIDGVTSVVNERGRIIVLEDDLVVTPHFLDFMNRALDKYEAEQQVIQVSGYMFPVKLKIKEDALFLPLTTSWGWATWKRAWQLFDPDAKGYAQVKADLALRKRFNLDGSYDYFSMLEDQLAGRVDSWAIRWYLVTFLLEGLTLYPRQSLILNAGFDGSGTHGAASGPLTRANTNEHFFPTVLPDAIIASIAWDGIHCRLGNLERPPLNGLKMLLRRIEMILSRLCGKPIVNK
jgi:Glycosyl transferase family 2